MSLKIRSCELQIDTSNEQCEVCIHAKLTKTLSLHVERINERLDLIYVT